jgi:hypothetical protein
MPQLGVRDLVSENAGQVVLGVEVLDEPGIDVDETARRAEGGRE